MDGVGPDFEAKMTDLKKQEDEFLKNALEGFITAKQIYCQIIHGITAFP